MIKIISQQFNNKMIVIQDDEDIKYMFSYGTCIIKKSSDLNNPYQYYIELDAKYWDYSTTTGKHRNAFLGETKAETQAKINSGEYKLTNLN